MTKDLHTLTGPYSLNALPADEAAAFEVHLDGCGACRAEIAEFRATAAQLGDAVAVTPPASMRASVMAEIAATRQESPKVVQFPTQTATLLRRFAMPAAAAIAVIAVGLTFALGSLTGRVNELQDRENTLNAVLASADVTLLQGSSTDGSASAVASASRGEAVISLSGLDRAPDNMIYELWLVGADGAIPMGLFDADDNGAAFAVLRGDIGASQAIAITIEPAGGSTSPTSVPFLRVEIA